MASGRLTGLRLRWLFRRPGRFAGWLVAAALIAALGGCATVPSSGKPQSLTGNNGQPQAFVQPLPQPGPQAGWSPQEVIYGFLHASASFALDPGAAEQYLAPGVKWHPGSVTVVRNVIVGAPTPLRLNGSNPSAETTVAITGNRLASISSSGQYINQPGTTKEYTFTLGRYDGIWLIQSLPLVPDSSGTLRTPLLLAQTDFEQVFQPRNLYFFSENSQAELVPDPVFAPVQGGSASDLATRLVEGLLTGSQYAQAASWLSGATRTAFPNDTVLIGNHVTISSNLTATVNLGGSAVYVPSTQKEQMYAQLVHTLTDNIYAPRVANSVQLEFNGRPQQVNGGPAIVPAVGTGTDPLYFVAGGALFSQAGNSKPVVVSGAAQLGSLAGVTAMAISRAASPQVAAAMPYAQGCVVEVLTLGRPASSHTHVLSRSGGACTSLSWDTLGNVWAVAGSRAWLLRPSGGLAPVALPAFVTTGPPPAVLALRIASDNTRVALLVRMPDGNKLFLAGVSYGPAGAAFGPADPIGTIGTNDLSNPAAVSWYTPNYLAVLDGPELFQVPLTGGPAQPFALVPTGANSVSWNGKLFAVGTSTGQIFVSSGQDGSWQQVRVHGAPAAAAAAAYPG